MATASFLVTGRMSPLYSTSLPVEKLLLFVFVYFKVERPYIDVMNPRLKPEACVRPARSAWKSDHDQSWPVQAGSVPSECIGTVGCAPVPRSTGRC